MPRAARKTVEDPNIEGEEDQTTQALDEAAPQEQTRTGQVSEGELDLARSVAKRMGWTPKEAWTRDPAKWVDADKFLEQTPRELESLKERNRRTAQAAADAIEDQRRQARLEAQREVREAAEANDPDRAAQAAERLAKASGPPPQTVAWMGRNSWFNEDPDAQMLAVAEINRIAATGASIDDQLAGAEAKIKRLFPTHFGQAEEVQDREVPLRESRHAANPPALQVGTRGGDTRVKERSFADIPPGDRALYAKHFKRPYESSGLAPADAETKYAKSYWRNKGEA